MVHSFSPFIWITKPQICQVSGGNAKYINFSSDKPLHHPGNVHFRAIQVEEIPFDQALAAGSDQQSLPLASLCSASLSLPNGVLSDLKINRSIMSPAQSQRLDSMILENIQAFEEDLSGGYDNENDPYEATFSFKRENMAPPVKVWVPQFNRKCQDLLQAKCDELERQGVLQDPKRHGVDVRHVSPCFIQQKARAKHKPLENCDLSEIRFITCYNDLNDSIHPVSGRSKSYNDILAFLSRFKFSPIPWLVSSLESASSFFPPPLCGFLFLPLL
jgi:hypothetical protein